MSLLDLSMLPWYWGCLGFPWTMTSSGHISFNSDITKAMNSRPLSLCKMCGGTKIVQTSIKLKATSEAFFDVSGLILQNFVRWSWYTIIRLYLPSGLDWKSFNSTWPLLLNSFDRIGFTTTPFEMCFFYILQFSHSDRKSSIQSLEIFA